MDSKTSSNIGNKESLPDSQGGSQIDFSPSSRKYEVAVGNEITVGSSADCGQEEVLDANIIRLVSSVCLICR